VVVADEALRVRMQRVEGLLAEVEQFPDARARDLTRELVQLLMDVHGATLARMLELAGGTAVDAFARDELVSSLLLLYNLHPLGLEARVEAAVEAVRPFLRSCKADVELVHLRDGALRLRLVGGAGRALGSAVEEAVWAAAPDVTSLEIEGAEGPPEPERFPLPLLGADR
jgi:hypothetical protein